MNIWDRREAHALVDAFACSGRNDEPTATRAHSLVDAGLVTDALELLRLVAAHVSVARA